ncbi:MAG: hypothetical protein BJ554DRAFT_106 [Olpidium bornovanus]|uniref:Secreted protein n=1 Tax=Olpidium bornovanus TaxID=278681 RepID=A0A8H8DIH0_9FUNG|nr:MAG: hypothetical protein BJ554DRAFT_106 [Olpidium bornovanus]
MASRPSHRRPSMAGRFMSGRLLFSICLLCIEQLPSRLRPAQVFIDQRKLLSPSISSRPASTLFPPG